MRVSDFQYDLPEELIAAFPSKQRSGSRLMCLSAGNGGVQHRIFSDILELIRPEDLLVFNDTRVIPARLYGHKQTGGKVEVLIERELADNVVLAQLKVSKPPPMDSLIFFKGPVAQGELNAEMVTAKVLEKRDGMYLLQFQIHEPLLEVLLRIGHIPLPPYIRREDQDLDKERYQTVYAHNPGAVAAPTAGLHFDEALMANLTEKGVEFAFVTLHVGAGTFKPVRVENILEHKMHREIVRVSEAVCEQVKACKQRGGRVIAVGTTSVRSLESAARDRPFGAFEGDTDIFMYPGYEFQIVDAMITNFHLSESTLLMLVSAFAGRQRIFDAYKAAIEARYRFFSYGDAMFIYHGVA